MKTQTKLVIFVIIELSVLVFTGILNIQHSTPASRFFGNWGVAIVAALELIYFVIDARLQQRQALRPAEVPVESHPQ